METMILGIKGIFIIWHRDLLRFWRNKARVIAGMSFPIIWLLVFGNGISSSLELPVPGVKFVQFLFPGIIAQYLLFTATFSAVSILQDREFGFLKEVLVSPIPRSSIALGKILGGATTTSLQALLILFLAPFVGISVTPKLVLLMIPAVFFVAIALTALGVAIVARLKSLDSGQYIFQFMTFPLVFLSGAVFPLRNLPGWMDIATKINPVSYAVDFLRRVVFTLTDMPDQATNALALQLNGKPVNIYTDAGVILVFIIVLSTLATYLFKKAN